MTTLLENCAKCLFSARYYSFPFGGVARSQARAVLSHLVSFAINGGLEIEFRGVLIIGARGGGGGGGIRVGL